MGAPIGFYPPFLREDLYFRQPTSMPLGAAESGGQKRLYELERETVADHPSAQTEHVHVVVFDALPSREHVMDQPGADTGNLVDCYAGADAAATERHTTLDLARGERSGQGDDEIGIVVREVKRCAPKSKTSRPELRKLAAISFFNPNPPWSEAIPMRIVGCSSARRRPIEALNPKARS